MAERLEGPTVDRLVCVECATYSDEAAADWRAYLSSGDEVVIFCPGCARREFTETPTADVDD